MNKTTAAIVASLLAVGASGANAVEVFTTEFGTAAVATPGGVLPGSALGTFSSGMFSVGDATIVLGAAGDAVARLNGTTFLTLGFNLMGPATSITVNFFASSSNATDAGDASVFIDGGPAQVQDIVAINVNNPGPGGTLISKTFTGSFAAGLHTLKVDNTPAVGFRMDAVTVTAVPETSTYAMLLAGLAAVGFVARRRSA